jgi:hypothetical protein
MAVAEHPVLSNSAHVQNLPPSWGTLYELTKAEALRLFREATTAPKHLHGDGDIRTITPERGTTRAYTLDRLYRQKAKTECNRFFEPRTRACSPRPLSDIVPSYGAASAAVCDGPGVGRAAASRSTVGTGSTFDSLRQ